MYNDEIQKEAKSNMKHAVHTAGSGFNFCARTSKLTAQNFSKAIEEAKNIAKGYGTGKYGKTSFIELSKGSAGLKEVNLNGKDTLKDIKDFNKIAKKHNVQFSIKENKNNIPPDYLIFFKSNEADLFNSAMEEFTKNKFKSAEQSVEQSSEELNEKSAEKVANEAAKAVKKVEKTVKKSVERVVEVVAPETIPVIKAAEISKKGSVAKKAVKDAPKKLAEKGKKISEQEISDPPHKRKERELSL